MGVMDAVMVAEWEGGGCRAGGGCRGGGGYRRWMQLVR